MKNSKQISMEVFVPEILTPNCDVRFFFVLANDGPNRMNICSVMLYYHDRQGRA